MWNAKVISALTRWFTSRKISYEWMPGILYFENNRQDGQHLKWESLCQRPWISMFLSQALQIPFPKGWPSLCGQWKRIKVHELWFSLWSKSCFLSCYCYCVYLSIKKKSLCGCIFPFAFILLRSVEPRQLLVMMTFAEGLKPFSHLNCALPRTFASVGSQAFYGSFQQISVKHPQQGPPCCPRYL